MKKASYNLTDVGVDPRENDILCSKDKSFANHPGNLVFRDRIDSMTQRYLQCRSKTEKMQMTKDIVSFLSNSYCARFLKIENGAWVQITNQAARDKVSHALRFAASRETRPVKEKIRKAKKSNENKPSRVRKTRSLKDARNDNDQTSPARQKALNRTVIPTEVIVPDLPDTDGCFDDVFQRQRLILESGMGRSKMGGVTPSMLLAPQQQGCFDSAFQLQGNSCAQEERELCSLSIGFEPISDTDTAADFALFDDDDLEFLALDGIVSPHLTSPLSAGA
mmetsp:Transcript_31919/g.66619  ORF Transcript_31919/g.66619 Transcript_31919/m.66619 type:complete len:278 (-) Transcript_31919:77-910(-)